jgi:hypothetical protein
MTYLLDILATLVFSVSGAFRAEKEILAFLTTGWRHYPGPAVKNRPFSRDQKAPPCLYNTLDANPANDDKSLDLSGIMS